MESGAPRLPIGILVWILLLPTSTPASGQTGITYRFREDTLVGRAWVLGHDARREIESGEQGIAAGRIEIWKNGENRFSSSTAPSAPTTSSGPSGRGGACRWCPPNR